MRGRSRIFFLAGLAIGLIVFVTAVPILVPVEKVRAGVERLLSSYAGETLRISGPGVVRMFPALEVDFRDIEARTVEGRRLVVSAERVRVSFDLVQYLLGRGVLASVEMMRPEMRVPLPTELLGTMTRRTRLDRMRPANLSVRGGTVVFVDGDGAAVSRLDGVDLEYAWPRPSGRLRLGATFSWRGQPVTVSLQGHGPKTLANGETGNLTLSLTTPAARVAFAGQTTVVDRLQLEGTVSLSAAHPLALARWLSGGDPAGFDIGRATLDGRLKLAGSGATVSEAELRLGSTRGEGVLSAQWDSARPLLRGTIDFGALAVERSAVAALAPGLVGLVASPSALRAADLDLRISTERLRVETVDVARVAATVVVKDGQLTGQIAEARVAEGDVSARLSTQPQGDAVRLALDVSADRVGLGRVASLLGWDGPQSGVLSGEARVEALAAPPPAVVTGLTGRARFRLTQVRFAHAPEWLTPVIGGPDGVFGSEGGGVPLSFDLVGGEATLAGTTINVARLTADGPGLGLTLTGSIDILRGGLGLSGVRSTPVAGPTRQQGLTPLRLGGTLVAPKALPTGRAPGVAN